MVVPCEKISVSTLTTGVLLVIRLNAALLHASSICAGCDTQPGQELPVEVGIGAEPAIGSNR
jgi:hypothetical protein